MSDFERWTNVGISGVSSSRLGPRWAIVGAAACLAMIFVATIGFRSGAFRGALVAVGLVGLVLLFFRTWAILTARTRRYLVSRSDWGDLTRLALLGAAYVAIPAIGAIAGLVLIGVMDALDRIASGASIRPSSLAVVAPTLVIVAFLDAVLSFRDRRNGNRT